MNRNVKRVRALPLMLVLLFLTASIFSNILRHFVIRSENLTVDTALLILEWPDVPFSTAIVLWLASRAGRTSWSTWLVPIAMLVIASAFPALILLLSIFLSIGSGFSLGTSSYHQFDNVWHNVFRPSITSYVFMAFAFRATTLHLRPIDTTASNHHLSVTTLMLLTATVAVMLSLDLSTNQWSRSEQWQDLIANKSLTYFGVLLPVLYEFNSTLPWFSIAWLMVAQTPRRWIGVLGFSMHWIIAGLYYFFFLPLYMKQWQTMSNSQMLFDTWYFAERFAVNIFYNVIAIGCFGIIHAAGYRWDIYRSSRTEEVELEQNADAIPPIMLAHIEV